MITIEAKLKSLVDNARDFKDACEISVSTVDLPDRVGLALEYGEKLQADLADIMIHMVDIKQRLEKS